VGGAHPYESHKGGPADPHILDFVHQYLACQEDGRLGFSFSADLPVLGRWHSLSFKSGLTSRRLCWRVIHVPLTTLRSGRSHDQWPPHETRSPHRVSVDKERTQATSGAGSRRDGGFLVLSWWGSQHVSKTSNDLYDAWRRSTASSPNWGSRPSRYSRY
jgi:hypothetical protein